MLLWIIESKWKKLIKPSYMGLVLVVVRTVVVREVVGTVVTVVAGWAQIKSLKTKKKNNNVFGKFRTI